MKWFDDKYKIDRSKSMVWEKPIKPETDSGLEKISSTSEKKDICNENLKKFINHLKNKNSG